MQAFLVFFLVVAVERKAELLDGRNDDLVGVIIGEHPPDEGFGVSIFFYTAFLKFVEFFPCLSVKVFAVHHKQAFFNIRVILEQGRGLEGCQRLAAAGGVPDIAIAPVLVDAVHDGPHRIDLIGPHHHEFLFAGNQHHVTADHFAQCAFGEKLLGEVVYVGDFLIIFSRKLINRQEAFVSIKTKVLAMVIGKIPGIGLVAHNEKLHKAEQRIGIAVAGVVFIVNDLLHGTARTDIQCLEFNLHNRHAVDQQNHVIAVIAVLRVDSQLVDHLKGIFAPVLDIDQGIEEWGAIFTLEAVALTQDFGGGKHISADNLIP